jgi:hypothetical protein
VISALSGFRAEVSRVDIDRKVDQGISRIQVEILVPLLAPQEQMIERICKLPGVDRASIRHRS